MNPARPGAPSLFVRAGVLGDFVLTLPVLEALLREGEVDVVCPARFAALLPLVPGGRGVGTVWDVGGAEVGWLFGAAPPPRRWDRAVGFSAAVGDALRALGVPRVDHVDAVPPGPAAAHFGAVLGLADPAPRLIPPRPGPARILLAPGASGAAKRDAPSWWLAVAAALDDLPVAWVLGPEEAGEAWPGLVLRPDLVDTVVLAARSVWAGADSGPGHLAAAAGARVVTRFLSTDPGRWAPRGAHVVGAEETPERMADLVRGAWNSIVGNDNRGAAG